MAQNIWRNLTFILIIVILFLSIIISYRIGNQNGFDSAIDFLSKIKVMGLGKIQ